MRHILRRRRLKRLIVTLKDQRSFDGVLFDHDSEAWVLRNAIALEQGENGRDLRVDGELVLLVSEIDFAQRP